MGGCRGGGREGFFSLPQRPSPISVSGRSLGSPASACLIDMAVGVLRHENNILLEQTAKYTSCPPISFTTPAVENYMTQDNVLT